MKRYFDLIEYDHAGVPSTVMHESPDGPWVRFEDADRLRHLLQLAVDEFYADEHTWYREAVELLGGKE